MTNFFVLGMRKGSLIAGGYAIVLGCVGIPVPKVRSTAMKRVSGRGWDMFARS